jgi:glutamate racemase
MLNKNLPIGVFDSGVGGLTVLRALQDALPNESFIYLGDTARLPYGTKSAETVTQYALHASHILAERQVKLLVIACNTASTVALDVLEKAYAPMPVIGVLKAGARAACLATRDNTIAVIATEATINAKGYEREIAALKPDAHVVSRACSVFVSLAEEGWANDPITIEAAKRYLNPLLHDYQPEPDCLVLGCTHFPVLKDAIHTVAGNKVTIVDSASATAVEVKALLDEQDTHTKSNAKPQTHFIVTDAPTRFTQTAERFLGRPVDPATVELVDSQFVKMD